MADRGNLSVGVQPSLDSTLLEKAEGDARYLVRDLHPKERVQRVMGQTYVGVKGPRILNRAGRIRMLLAGVQDAAGLAESARAHLEDAKDPELPQDVREEHYDIAGARLWVLIQRVEGGEVPMGLSLAFDEWLKGLSV